jgi:DNA-binding transcriptional MerR regulator
LGFAAAAAQTHTRIYPEPEVMEKSADAYRTISEVAEELDLPQHVLRFWETRFPNIKPLKRAGGRRYYRPQDIELLRAIKQLLYGQGYTIKGVQRILKEQGARAVTAASQAEPDFAPRAERELAQGEAPLDDPIGRISEPRSADAHGQAATTDEGAAFDDSAGRLPAWATNLSVEDAARLRAALTELEDCERILKGVRRA